MTSTPKRSTPGLSRLTGDDSASCGPIVEAWGERSSLMYTCIPWDLDKAHWIRRIQSWPRSDMSPLSFQTLRDVRLSPGKLASTNILATGNGVTAVANIHHLSMSNGGLGDRPFNRASLQNSC